MDTVLRKEPSGAYEEHLHLQVPHADVLLRHKGQVCYVIKARGMRSRHALHGEEVRVRTRGVHARWRTRNRLRHHHAGTYTDDTQGRHSI